MAGLETKGEPLALRAFRHAGRVLVESAGGEAREGRGIVSPLRQEAGEPGGERHSLGVLGRPLKRFLGWAPEPDKMPGGTLVQGEERYTVLDVKPVLLGGRRVCVRALLEREVKANDVQ